LNSGGSYSDSMGLSEKGFTLVAAPLFRCPPYRRRSCTSMWCEMLKACEFARTRARIIIK
jgi:hypothetical protein